MDQLHIIPKAEDDSLLGRAVAERHDLIDVRPGTTVFVLGEPVIVYGRLRGNYDELRAVLHHAPYGKHRRLTQLINQHEVSHTHDVNFGFNPSNPIFGTAAGPTKFDAHYPNWSKILAAHGRELCDLYQEFNPTRFQRHKAAVEKEIQPHWRIDGTPFTQGVLNNANALGYHYDRDNLQGGWSAMTYFKKDTSGGNLIVPSLGLRFINEDQGFFFFDGQSVMHGVTPIVKESFSAYRYSIVFYTRASMRNLGSYSEERDRASKTELRKHQKKLARGPDQKQ